MKSLFINTYRWHDKIYGNSYFSSAVYIDGEFAFSLPFQYGYERQDEEMLRQELVKQGLIEDGSYLRAILKNADCHYYRATQYTTKSEAQRFGRIEPSALVSQ